MFAEFHLSCFQQQFEGAGRPIVHLGGTATTGGDNLCSSSVAMSRAFQLSPSGPARFTTPLSCWRARDLPRSVRCRRWSVKATLLAIAPAYGFPVQLCRPAGQASVALADPSKLTFSPVVHVRCHRSCQRSHFSFQTAASSDSGANEMVRRSQAVAECNRATSSMQKAPRKPVNSGRIRSAPIEKENSRSGCRARFTCCAYRLGRASWLPLPSATLPHLGVLQGSDGSPRMAPREWAVPSRRRSESGQSG